MKKTNLFAILALAATPAFLHAQTTSYSDVVGYSNYPLTAGQYIFSPTFVKASVLQASASVSSKTISVSGVTTSTLAPSAFIDGTPNYPSAYVEVLSGAYSGVAFDITSVGTSTVTCADFPSELNGQTISFVIRKHVTLADVFTPSSGLAEFSDAITLFNSDGSTSIRYLAGGVITTDDFATPAGHTPIYPGAGVILNIGGSVTLSLSGQVKPTASKVPVYPGVNNIVGTFNPSSSLKATSTTLATSLGAFTDSATLYSNNGSFSLQNFIYSDGTSVTDDGFTPYDPATSPAIPSGSGLIINVPAPAYIVLNSPVN